DEILGIFDQMEVFGRDAAAEYGLGDDAGARSELQHRQARMRIADRGHLARGDGARGDDRSDLARLGHPALEEAQFLIEALGECLAQSRSRHHPVSSSRAFSYLRSITREASATTWLSPASSFSPQPPYSPKDSKKS